jgi:hypothetical protein
MRQIINRKGFNAMDEASVIAQKENKFRIFPVIIDMNMTNIIYNKSQQLKDDLKQIMRNETFILPFSCDHRVLNLKVEFDKIGILVLDIATRSDVFYEEILNNRIEYVIIKGKMYGIRVKEQVTSHVANFLVNNGKQEEANALKSIKRCIILLPLKNVTKIPSEIESEYINESCTFKLIPFLGTVETYAGSSYLMNINVDVFPNVLEKNIPIHVIAYRARD